MAADTQQLARCLAEQSRCRDHLALHPGDRGAILGLSDWAMEEALLRTEYERFLQSKSQYPSDGGFDPVIECRLLFPFQQSVLQWSLRRGRAGVFLDCGMGKTAVQLVWAANVAARTGKRVLILTPLAVSSQTVGEAGKFSIDADRSRDGKLPGSAIVVTNYERLHHFRPEDFAGVVCDESSAIKSFDGQRRAAVTEFLRTIRYRLLCTATASPNDYTELGTSSEALGELGHVDMLGRFFRNDNRTVDTRGHWKGFSAPRAYEGPRWRFKGHAQEPFWQWVCSWARAARKPSDLGFDDDGFVLPPLIENEHVVETRRLADGMLFALPATNMREEREERRRTIEERCEAAAALVNGTGKPAVVWCHLNDEGDLLERLIPDARQVAGKTPDEQKEEIFDAFGDGGLRVVVLKDKIGAWGLNWQHCAHIVRFATHSWEAHYQAVRRCWRFGQKSPVTVDLVATEGEKGIKENLARKSRAADRMFAAMVRHMQGAALAEDGGARRVRIPDWIKAR